MSKQDYWDEMVRVSFAERGIVATEEQLLGVAGDMDACCENIGMAYPSGPPDRPSVDPRDREIARLKEEARLESIKVRCEWCKGHGYIVDGWGRKQGCEMCESTGKVMPR